MKKGAYPTIQMQKPVARQPPVKHYDTDWAKGKVHVLLGEMLDSTLLAFRKPHELRVLHFAGIDAQETRAVYLSRGIPPGNIVTLERDLEVARAIEARKLGISVINTSLEQYVGRETGQGRKFDYDVVSLDFTGPIKGETLMLIEKIIANTSRKHLLLHTANLLMREPAGLTTYQKAAESLALRELTQTGFLKRFLETGLLTDYGSLYRKREEMVGVFSDSEGRTALKKQAYPYIIHDCFEPMYADIHLAILRFLYNGIKTETLANGEIIVNITNPQLFPLKKLLAEARFDMLHRVTELFIIPRLLRELETAGLDKRNVGLLLSYLGYALRGHPTLIPKEARHYSYISETGSPMIGSVYFASRGTHVYEASKEMARELGFPGEFAIRDKSKFERALREASRQERKIIAGFYRDGFFDLEAEFLGSSSKPVLTKSRFIEELERGAGMEEIKARYRGWTGKPLAQWKAHHTMGTYVGGDQTGPIAIAPEDTGIDKITREEAYDLLLAGIPPQEIYDAYPTSFRTSQLRAFQSHIKMKEEKRD